MKLRQRPPMAQRYGIAATLVGLLAGHSVQGQQFANSGVTMDTDWPGISPSCATALKVTIACPLDLHTASLSFDRLQQEVLESICTSQCQSSLTAARNTIASGCKGANDTFGGADGLTYPATFVIDRYIDAYDIVCRKDPATGKYCDVLGTEWINDNNSDVNRDCHDCNLGILQTRLNSPYEYSEETEERFRSLTVSCGKTQYPITSPAAYAVSTSTSNFVTLAPATHTTTPSSTEPSRAYTLTVPTQLPLAPGTLQSCYKYRNYFSPLPVVDQSLSAKAASDKSYINSCDFVRRLYSIDIGDLLEWNPTLDADISQCALQEGFSYCVLKDEDSENWAPLWHSNCLSLESMWPGTITDGTDPRCDCYTIIEGNEAGTEEEQLCEDLVEDLGLPIGNIRKYNDWIGTDCDNSLYAGLAKDKSRAVCIGVGIIKTRKSTRTSTRTTNMATSTGPSSSTTA